MAKSVSTSHKPRKQHIPEFHDEVFKLAACTGVVPAARKLSFYEFQHYASRSKQQHQATSSED